MMKPTVHLNGTSREALAEGYENAGRALLDALEALQAASPNARDYYPQGDSAFNQAARDHSARVEALRAVYSDLVTLYEHVVDFGM